MERDSRPKVEARAGLKNASLFEKGVQSAWAWAEPSLWIRWFTDGERRYAKELWKIATVFLPPSMTTQAYPYRKVWREGLEVAIKIKGSQGHPRLEWVKIEHPFTPISPKPDVHANHARSLQQCSQTPSDGLSTTTKSLC